MLRFLTILMVASALFGQSTTQPDAAQYIKHAGGTKTSGYCLTWNSSGLVTQATCGAGGGETNAGANLGVGSVVYTGKSGVNLQFRSFTVGSNKLSVTQNANDIAYDLIPANNLLSSFGGSLNLSQIAQGGATTGQLLQWNGSVWIPASTGGGGGPADTDALAEGAVNLYHTTARARAALSVTGILSYNNGTGVMSCANCADITSNYGNPTWISSLAYAKITGVPGFELQSNKAAASGYASLNASTLVPSAQLGTGTANSTTFLRGDGTWTNPAGSVNLLLAGASIGTRPGLNFIAGSGVTIGAVDDAGNNRVNITATADTSVMLSKVTAKDGTPWYCRSTSGNDTYACNIDPAYTSTSLTRGQYVFLDADTANTGAATLAIGGGTVRDVVTNAGAAPADGTVAANRGALLYWNGTAFSIVAGGSSGVSSVSGTTNEIDSTGGATPVLSLSSVMNLTSKTVRVPNSTSLPGTCTVGDSYMDTNATSGARWFLCEATNSWVAQGTAGGLSQAVVSEATMVGTCTSVDSMNQHSDWIMPSNASGLTPALACQAPGAGNYRLPTAAFTTVADQEAVLVRQLKINRTGAFDLYLYITDTAGSGVFKFDVTKACLSSGAAYDPVLSYTDSQSIQWTSTAATFAYRSLTGVTIPGACATGDTMYLRIKRDGAVGGNSGGTARLVSAYTVQRTN